MGTPTRVFGEITEALRAGKNVLLRGPQGCGKTTLLHVFAKDMSCRLEAVLVFDGVSARDLETLLSLDTALRSIRVADKPFGGIRILMSTNSEDLGGSLSRSVFEVIDM